MIHLRRLNHLFENETLKKLSEEEFDNARPHKMGLDYIWVPSP